MSLLFSTSPVSSTDKLGKNLAELGNCKKAEIYRNKSIFIECDGDGIKIEERCGVIRELIEDPSLSENEKSFLMRRLARLAGGVAVLRVGGSTELEVQEKRDRVEDALATCVLRYWMQRFTTINTVICYTFTLYCRCVWVCSE